MVRDGWEKINGTVETESPMIDSQHDQLLKLALVYTLSYLQQQTKSKAFVSACEHAASKFKYAFPRFHENAAEEFIGKERQYFRNSSWPPETPSTRYYKG